MNEEGGEKLWNMTVFSSFYDGFIPANMTLFTKLKENKTKSRNYR